MRISIYSRKCPFVRCRKPAVFSPVQMLLRMTGSSISELYRDKCASFLLKSHPIITFLPNSADRRGPDDAGRLKKTQRGFAPDACRSLILSEGSRAFFFIIHRPREAGGFLWDGDFIGPGDASSPCGGSKKDLCSGHMRPDREASGEKQDPNSSPIEKMRFGSSCFGGDKISKSEPGMEARRESARSISLKFTVLVPSL